MKDTYFDEWDENTNVAWWNAGRKQLNVAVRLVNQWTIDGCEPDDAPRILRTITMGLQTYGAQDDRAEWGDVLRQMRRYIKNRLEDA